MDTGSRWGISFLYVSLSLSWVRQWLRYTEQASDGILVLPLQLKDKAHDGQAQKGNVVSLCDERCHSHVKN